MLEIAEKIRRKAGKMSESHPTLVRGIIFGLVMTALVAMFSGEMMEIIKIFAPRRD